MALHWSIAWMNHRIDVNAVHSPSNALRAKEEGVPIAS
jgi:hypothetical protein